MFSRVTIVLACVLSCSLSHAFAAASPRLLQEAVDNWLGERDRWAFTQHAVEYEGITPHERLERFDPSRVGDERWQLIAIDGHAPTPEERQKWADKKFKHHHHRINTPIGDFFDFESARVVAETPRLVRFEVPLRRDKNWLFPVDKVGVRVTINKETKALEHLAAHVREPFKVLLGVARVTGGTVDLDFLHFNPAAPALNGNQPAGQASMSVFKMGERVDFTWSDFKRVTPTRDTGQSDAPASAELLTSDVP